MDVSLHTETETTSAPDAGITRYLREVGRCRLLSRAEERVLLHRVRTGDRGALNALVTANLKWVVAACGEYREQGLPMTDLIAEGNLGLIRAAVSFDSDHSCRFTAYALWWIRQSLERALADQNRLQTPPYGDGVDPPSEIVPEVPAATSGWAAQDPALPPGIRRALEEVPEPGSTVLKLFFGLDAEGKGPMSLEQIGRLLGMDPRRIGQLKDLALRRLRRQNEK